MKVPFGVKLVLGPNKSKQFLLDDGIPLDSFHNQPYNLFDMSSFFPKHAFLSLSHLSPLPRPPVLTFLHIFAPAEHVKSSLIDVAGR